ncbi:MAG: hypothetical protein FJ405_01910 [Verrucomicrobia bacterium]|nr:hypothetical protein [Verrucomicrobiota bacterium]
MLSHELFGIMSTELGSEILDFAHQSDKKLYRAVLDSVASVKRVRPVFIERQSRAERNPFLLSALKRSDLGVIGDNLIRHWLLEKHGGMLSDFLNALSIPNKAGVVDNLPSTVSDVPLRSAVDTLFAKYPPEPVKVYLHAFNQFNQAEWANLGKLLTEDPRLAA